MSKKNENIFSLKILIVYCMLYFQIRPQFWITPQAISGVVGIKKISLHCY